MPVERTIHGYFSPCRSVASWPEHRHLLLRHPHEEHTLGCLELRQVRPAQLVLALPLLKRDHRKIVFLHETVDGTQERIGLAPHEHGRRHRLAAVRAEEHHHSQRSLQAAARTR
jgi:hypothetical protein